MEIQYLRLLEPDTQHEGEKNLVSLEEWATDREEDGSCQVGVEQLDSYVHILTGVRVPDRLNISIFKYTVLHKNKAQQVLINHHVYPNIILIKQVFS